MVIDRDTDDHHVFMCVDMCPSRVREKADIFTGIHVPQRGWVLIIPFIGHKCMVYKLAMWR